MIFNIENVVYMYIGVCISMLIFNCILIFYRRTENIWLTKKLYNYKKLIMVQLEHIENKEALDPKIQKRIQKRLRSLGQLRAFHNAASELLESDRKRCMEYLRMCKNEFTKLSLIYKQRDSMQKAYFAYIMSCYQLCDEGEQSILVDAMRQFVNDKSAYCRENALKALYSFGDKKNIYYALKLMSDNGVFHHTKLITDGLLTFAGNHESLAEYLWEHLGEFRTDFQIAFIQYIRVVSGSYCEQFYDVLIQKEADRELQIAMIRYFGKYHYEPIKKLLFHHLSLTETIDWELAAVSAAVLREYEGEDTFEALIQGLYHLNWYVRYNSAESLNYLAKDYEELASVYNGDNRYAKEMLEYQHQRKLLSEHSRTGAVS